MKLAHSTVLSHEVQILDDVLCNRCGGSCKIGSWGADTIATNARGEHIGITTNAFGGLVEASVHGSYHSTEQLFDCTSYTFSICEACLVAMFDEFKLPPHIHCRIDDEDVTLEAHRTDREVRAANTRK